jgi:hypothetical protein
LHEIRTISGDGKQASIQEIDRNDYLVECQNEKHLKKKEEKVNLDEKNYHAKRFKLLKKLVASEKNLLIKELIVKNVDTAGLVSVVEDYNKVAVVKGFQKDNAYSKSMDLILQGKFYDGFVMENRLIINVHPQFPSWNGTWNTQKKGMLKEGLRLLEDLAREPGNTAEEIEGKKIIDQKEEKIKPIKDLKRDNILNWKSGLAG